MSLIFAIVRAAHANGTHHKLALDALMQLRRPDAESWRRVILCHAKLYLEGSKAPDVEFKDFKNHVLHVRDGYWGGAPEKADAWYRHVIEALRDRDFARAAYAAGVLSHYVTDPIQPFHTAQSEAENAIHRAVEWSISRSYDSLVAEASTQIDADQQVSAPEGPGWLKAHLIAGAERSNASYETLLAHYDIQRGVTDPPSGLDSVARASVGALILYASKCFAAVLDRAFDEGGVSPPEVSLTAPTLLATLDIPRKWLEKRLTDRETRRVVEAMYDELQRTGRVDETLPEDDRTVRDLYAREVLAPRALAKEAERAARISESVRPVLSTPATVAPAALAGEKRSVPRSTQPADAIPAREPAPNDVLASLQRRPRPRLSGSDDVEAAPSIGPKMARRLVVLGVATVDQLLAAEAQKIAEGLADSRITAATVTRWQDQARLMLAIPELKGAHAELLVGAGLRSVDDLAAADPATLASAVLAFATETEGRRILRSGETPDLEAIRRWCQEARAAQAA